MENKYRNLCLAALLVVASASYAQWDYSYDMYADKSEQVEKSEKNSRWSTSDPRGATSRTIGDEELPVEPGVVPVADGLIPLLLTAGIITLYQRRKKRA